MSIFFLSELHRSGGFERNVRDWNPESIGYLYQFNDPNVESSDNLFKLLVKVNNIDNTLEYVMNSKVVHLNSLNC